MTTPNKPTRPVLRWHGGKWRLAPWVLEHLPEHRVYVEPFGGAASVLMRKPRSYTEVYNDLDGEVVALFRILRDPAQAAQLRRNIELTPFAREEFLSAYHDAKTPMEQARRLIIRCFMGFGSNAHNPANRSGFRANSTRSGTRPAHDWMSWPKQIECFTERLDGVVIENRDALEVMRKHDGPDTLHYVDPPYPLETRVGVKSGRKCYRHEMSDEQHRELGACLLQLEGMVVLSGYPCPLYDEEMFPHWQRITRKAYADGARARTEALWLNPAAHERLHPTQTSLLKQGSPQMEALA